MFDLLKKKFGKFAEKVKERVDQKPLGEEKLPKEAAEKALERPLKEKAVEDIEKKALEEQPVEAKEEAVSESVLEEAPVEAEEESLEEKAIEEEPPIQAEEEAKAVEDVPGVPAEEEAAAQAEEVPVSVEEKRRLKPAVSVRGRLKGALTGTVELEEKDLKGLLWELELALLEADVEQTTAEEICREISSKLVGKKLKRGQGIEQLVREEIGKILLGMMQAEPIDLVSEIKAKKDKPYKILFLGPNGTGKTTTIAKLTAFLQGKGLRVIWAAADTFRAASIEQLEKHAKNLGIRVIKHQYGADPAAVAFDAVKAAQSKRIDVVLIDSAGRQETNRNLMAELEKISRVIKPDLKLYVGEAFTGQALLKQAREYESMVGIDGFVLTKIDCDSKGGTTISLLYKLHKPVLFIGTGQEYKDLRKFEPGFVIDRVLG